MLLVTNHFNTLYLYSPNPYITLRMVTFCRLQVTELVASILNRLTTFRKRYAGSPVDRTAASRGSKGIWFSAILAQAQTVAVLLQTVEKTAAPSFCLCAYYTWVITWQFSVRYISGACCGTGRGGLNAKHKLLLITVMGTAEKELLFCDTFNHEGNEVWTLTKNPWTPEYWA